MVASVHRTQSHARKHEPFMCPFCSQRSDCHPPLLDDAVSLASSSAGFTPAYASRPPEVMCTCRWVRAEERWIVKVYEPLTGVSYTRIMDLHGVKRTINLVKQARGMWFHPSDRLTHLVDGTARYVRSLVTVLLGPPHLLSCRLPYFFLPDLLPNLLHYLLL